MHSFNISEFLRVCGLFMIHGTTKKFYLLWIIKIFTCFIVHIFQFQLFSFFWHFELVNFNYFLILSVSDPKKQSNLFGNQIQYNIGIPCLFNEFSNVLQNSTKNLFRHCPFSLKTLWKLQSAPLSFIFYNFSNQ